MSGRKHGTPFVGYLSLVHTGLGPTNIPVTVPPGGSAYTLAARERLMVTNIAITTNDSTQELVTIDNGATSPTTLVSAYVSASTPPYVESIPPGDLPGYGGTLLRATAGAITSGKTVEITIKGYIATI